MNSLHQPYLDQGEIIYAAKIDSVISRSGYKKVQLDIYSNAQNIDFLRVYYNDFLDSVDVSIEGKRGVFNLVIPNLIEKKYVFNTISYDMYKNKSLSFESVGTVYGDRYNSTLLNRKITSITRKDDSVVINWGDPLNKMEKCEFIYQTTDGEVVVLNILKDVDQTIIDNYGIGIKYRTAFIPEENALELFYTKYTDNIPALL
ncbi:DUF4998 domain-containing protein [Halosquirtibacter laminarini]|uniref:DUF4998 domain-containing protein n=1 Tax=Halosquirtibacter laminarini TaxID=3374600 RepID=A0AC61NGB9_9BACT|nr:DUF4998 domain-containing protein [Prolixibacteraceae bacterium]